MRIVGIVADLLTPFRKGELDEAAFARSVRAQGAAHSAAALNVASVMGEGPCLTEYDVDRLLRLAVLEAQGTPVLATVCANGTALAVRRGAKLLGAGVSALVYPTPFYNKPSARGVVEHFASISRELAQPYIIQHDASRSGPLALEALIEALQLPCVVGFLDNDPDPWWRLAQLRARCPNLPTYCGRHMIAKAYMQSGGSGCFSSLGNLWPGIINSSVDVERSGEWNELAAAIEMDQTPASLKCIAKHLGLMENDLRLPCVTLGTVAKAHLLSILRRAKCI